MRITAVTPAGKAPNSQEQQHEQHRNRRNSSHYNSRGDSNGGSHSGPEFHLTVNISTEQNLCETQNKSQPSPSTYRPPKHSVELTISSEGRMKAAFFQYGEFLMRRNAPSGGSDASAQQEPRLTSDLSTLLLSKPRSQA